MSDKYLAKFRSLSPYQRSTLYGVLNNFIALINCGGHEGFRPIRISDTYSKHPMTLTFHTLI